MAETASTGAQKRILRRMSAVLGKDFRSEPDFPLAIDEVLAPLLQGCREYVTAWGR
jgi:hypothetical protein